MPPLGHGYALVGNRSEGAVMLGPVEDGSQIVSFAYGGSDAILSLQRSQLETKIAGQAMMLRRGRVSTSIDQSPRVHGRMIDAFRAGSRSMPSAH
jgi:hypothetical protein